MNNSLVLRNKTYERVYRSVGVIMLLVAIISGAGRLVEKTMSGILLIISFSLVGLMFVTLNFGTLRNSLVKEGDMLIIRWQSKLLKTRVPVSEIREITDSDSHLIISLLSGRSVKLSSVMLEPDEKRAVIKFIKNLKDL